MLEIKNFSIKYDDTYIIKDQDLCIKNNVLTLISGESGSGKTSILYTLGLISKHIYGTYTINGKDISNATEDEKALIRRHNIGFVFQEYMLLDHFNVYENMQYYANIVNKSLTQKQAKEYLQSVLLDIPLDRPLFSLSGGQKQRLAIACVLCKNPDILILDEPTSALDKDNTDTILKILVNLKKDKTIIITSHNKNVIDYCDEIIEIKDSKINKIKETSIIQNADFNVIQSVLPLSFYKNYIQKFKVSMRKTSSLIIALVFTTLMLSVAILNISEHFMDISKKEISEVSQSQLFITNNEPITKNSIAELGKTEFYPYYDTTVEIMGNVYPVVPYFDTTDFEQMAWTTFDYSSTKGMYISYYVYNQMQEVIVATENLDVTFKVNADTGVITKDTPIKYKGILKNGLDARYIEDCNEFVYIYYKTIEDLISQDTEVNGYTVFCNSYKDTMDIKNKAESLGFKVIDYNGSLDKIQDNIHFLSLLKTIIITGTIMIGTFLMILVYLSYFGIRQKEFALLKSMGLKTKNIIKLVSFEMLKQNISCFLCVVLITIGLSVFLLPASWIENILILSITQIMIITSLYIVIGKNVKKVNPEATFRN